MKRRGTGVTVVLAGLLLGAQACPAVEIVPMLGIGTTWSDNPPLQPDAASRPGWINELVPGVRAQGHGSLLDFFVDAHWHVLRYTSASYRNSTQGDVDARATLSSPNRIAFLDGNVQVSQQSLSPFGPTSTPDRPNGSGNRVETRLAQAAPYVRGYLGDAASYQAKVIASALRTDADGVPPVNSVEVDLRVRNPSPSTRLGWILEGRAWDVRPQGEPSARDERLRASFLAEVAYHVRVSAIVGHDTTDFLSLTGERESGTSRGVGLDWNPGPRTQLAAVWERRFYGDFHDVQFQWRSPKTAWRVASLRDLTVLPNVLANGASSATLQLMTDLLTSAIPDRLQREAAARGQLEQAAIGGAAPLSSGYITSRPLEYQEDEIAAALLGIRDTVTFRADRRRQRVRGPALFPTPVSLGEENLRQVRYSVQWAHRLTPLTTFTLEAARLDNKSLDISQLTSLERQATASVRSTLGPHAILSLGLRRLLFTGSTTFGSFSENAIFGMITIQL